ncbi:hypothetical protein EV175_000882 [Coemansia sp. RSA 1933]|nr:hypothetical protein EV175_000882 [Coemansia sp. RSA 1933]
MKFSVFYVVVGFAVVASSVLAQDNGVSSSTESAMLASPTIAGQAMDTDTAQDTDTDTEQESTDTNQKMYTNTDTNQEMYTNTEPSMPFETEESGILNVAGNPVHIGGGMPSMIQPLVNRFVSFFDLSHVSTTPTDTPVMLHHVYDPATGKFTYLSMDVMQSGGAYYVPVCSISSFTSGVATAADNCPYAIQLNPVPIDVAQRFLRLMHTVFNIIRNLALPKLWIGQSYAMSPSQPQAQQQ